MITFTAQIYLTLSIRPNYPSFLAPLLNILCLHRPDINSFRWTNTGASMCRGSLKNVAYEYVLTSPTVSRHVLFA